MYRKIVILFFIIGFIDELHAQSNIGSSLTETGNSTEEQLYNLHKEIEEKHNLAAKHPRKVKELKRLAKQEKEK